jgi:hypothetical protein
MLDPQTWRWLPQEFKLDVSRLLLTFAESSSRRTLLPGLSDICADESFTGSRRFHHPWHAKEGDDAAQNRTGFSTPT